MAINCHVLLSQFVDAEILYISGYNDGYGIGDGIADGVKLYSVSLMLLTISCP